MLFYFSCSNLGVFWVFLSCRMSSSLLNNRYLFNVHIYWDIKKGEFEVFLIKSILANHAEKCLSLLHTLLLNTGCALEKHLQLHSNLKVICLKTNYFVSVLNNQKLKIYLEVFCAGLNTDGVFSKTWKCMLCLSPLWAWLSHAVIHCNI